MWAPFQWLVGLLCLWGSCVFCTHTAYATLESPLLNLLLQIPFRCQHQYKGAPNIADWDPANANAGAGAGASASASADATDDKNNKPTRLGYIDIDSFESPKALAEYLKELDSDDDAYGAYVNAKYVNKRDSEVTGEYPGANEELSEIGKTIANKLLRQRLRQEVQSSVFDKSGGTRATTSLYSKHIRVHFFCAQM